MRVIVIGAGVIGLSSALCIQERFPEARVTVMAERFPPEAITSMVAAGIMLVMPNKDFPPRMLRAIVDSCQHYLELEKKGSEFVHGVRKRDGHVLYATKTYGESLPDDLMPLSSHAEAYGKAELLSVEECKTIFPDQPCSGWAVISCVVDTRRYLPYLLNEIHQRGGKMRRGKVADLSQLVSDDYDVIINCAGLGSRELANDNKMYPVKGQLIRFNTEGRVNNFMGIIMGQGQALYYIPHSFDTVAGVLDEGQKVDADVADQIEKFVKAAHPGFKDAPVIQRYIGLRPIRKGNFRMEQECIDREGRQIQVIHNYGHGSHGVGLSWGCGLQVVELLASIADNLEPQTKCKL